jgi:hypothetical protein
VLFNWTWHLGMLRGIDEHEPSGRAQGRPSGSQRAGPGTARCRQRHWVMTPRTLRLTSMPDAGLLPERGNCEVYELEDIATQIRH